MTVDPLFPRPLDRPFACFLLVAALNRPSSGSQTGSPQLLDSTTIHPSNPTYLRNTAGRVSSPLQSLPTLRILISSTLRRLLQPGRHIYSSRCPPSVPKLPYGQPALCSLRLRNQLQHDLSRLPPHRRPAMALSTTPRPDGCLVSSPVRHIRTRAGRSHSSTASAVPLSWRLLRMDSSRILRKCPITSHALRTKPRLGTSIVLETRNSEKSFLI